MTTTLNPDVPVLLPSAPGEPRVPIADPRGLVAKYRGAWAVLAAGKDGSVAVVDVCVGRDYASNVARRFVLKNRGAIVTVASRASGESTVFERFETVDAGGAR
jgi:hypothetical protein